MLYHRTAILEAGRQAMNRPSVSRSPKSRPSRTLLAFHTAPAKGTGSAAAWCQTVPASVRPLTAQIATTQRRLIAAPAHAAVLRRWQGRR